VSNHQQLAQAPLGDRSWDPAEEQISDRIVVRDLRLWAHVGVLESERQLGQWFELDLELGVDLNAAAAGDDLAASLDYSRAIKALQRQASEVQVQTLEHYSELMFDCLEELYGPVPMQLELRKCRAPVPGFGGRVAVRRKRHWGPS
jgi:dihydroneopterin aldolase